MNVNRHSAFTDADLLDGDAGCSRRKLLHENWSFRRAGDHVWRSATVPGCNFSDLQDNGEIADPFHGSNETELQWVEQEDWEYRCHFNLESDDLDCDVELVFDGLDTYATVILNGAEVLLADNMFRSYRLPCHSQLKIGENELVIIFRSPTTENLPKYQANGFTYPAENDKSSERLSVYARKAPYHFGWDWGPRFVASGIWRDAYLEFSKRARVANVRFQVEAMSDDQATLSFDVRIDAGEEFDGHLLVQCHEMDEVRDLRSVTIEQGQHQHCMQVTVPNPELWWPNGLGDAFLYTFSVALFDEAICLDRGEHRVGIRTVEVVAEEDEHGESFYLKVNGHPVFMKGANYIPSDSFLDRVSDDKYRRVFSSAVEANMNMLRVWGGGVYESDTFYDLADEHGILIWQDFMFACSLYPADEQFLLSVRAEATDNIARLRNHPCLALWCGNNEVAMGIECWDWPEKFGYSEELYARLKADYKKLFHELLPSIVKKEDGRRFYMPSSPISFWERPEDDGVGNSHFWGVWHGGQDFEEYRRRISRFVTEYGFQSFPVLDSVKQFASEKDWDIDSHVMQTHQRHPIANQLIHDYLLRSYPEPASFEQFLYLSQVQQADALRVAFEAHRSAMPYCMGTLYWQMNDCWPVASWSSIDYYGRWKALHYQARRCYAPVAVFVASHGEDLEVRVVSDLLDACAARLSIRLIDFSGTVLHSQEQLLSVQPNKSEIVYSCNRQQLIADHDPAGVVLVARLLSESELLSQSNYYFVATNKLALSSPAIYFATGSAGGRATISLASETLAKDVYVRVDGLEPHSNLSDNFFDLMPGEQKSLHLPVGTRIDDKSIDILSVFDTCASKRLI